MLLAVSAGDVITFASSSAVKGFLDSAGRAALPQLVASIGPSTSATLRELGVEVDIEADRHTSDGLVAALCGFAERHPRTRR
jgi:uroporphyrinogen III methyltransferase/synthase